MTGLWVKFTSWLYEERGDFNVGGGLGLVALVILVLFIFWLTESAGKTNFFD